MEKSLLYLKLSCAFIIAIVAVLGGLLPLLKHSKKFRTLGNCFSGGVFLSASLVHMLPEAVEGFESLGEGYYKKFAYIFCMLGILLPLFVEKVLMSHYSHTSLMLDVSEGNRKSIFSMCLLLMTLSIHSFIEGIALGVQNEYSDTSKVLWAILGHKFFAAFSLGMSMAKCQISARKHITLITVFSSTTPIGIMIGLGVSCATPNGVIVEASKAIAAGTFLYVAFVEIIIEEFGGHSHEDQQVHEQEEPDVESPSEHSKSKKKSQWVKFLMIVLGLIVMALLCFVEE